MFMQKKYRRKEFLKISLMANLALYVKPFSMPDETVAAPVLQSTENVTYYKKEDKEYEVLRKGFNKRIEKYPAVIALCKNENGISEALKYAKEKKLPVAVKSGGHCMEGFSCNNDGLVINLSLLNNIEWIDNETIKVGPACTLSALNDFLLPKNKILPGGSCATVGIAGLVLGGGYGLMSRKFGLTCDSLLEVTMVDGKGIIRNSSHEKDLLWACRGGGNGNFGVVSALKFKVHDCPDLMQSFRFQSFKINTANAKSILKEWFKITQNLPVSCFSAFVLNNNDIYILLTMTEKITRDTQIIIDKISLLTEKKSEGIAEPVERALKAFYGIQHPVRFKNACAGLYKSFDDIENYIGKVLETVVTTAGMIFQINTLGGEIQNADAAKGSSFPHRAFFYVSELQTYWDIDEQEKELIQKFEAVQQVFFENGINAQYCNYPDINFKNCHSLYYGSNYQKLQQIKNKYDPDNTIRYEQSIENK
jgi:FAD binding domain-containing protein/berberine-like enzyme